MEFSYSNLVQDPIFVEFYIYEKSKSRISNALFKSFSEQQSQCKLLYNSFGTTDKTTELDKYIACQLSFDQKIQRFLTFEEKFNEDMRNAKVI